MTVSRATRRPRRAARVRWAVVAALCLSAALLALPAGAADGDAPPPPGRPEPGASAYKAVAIRQQQDRRPAATTAPASAAAKQQTSPTGLDLPRVGLSLGIVIGLILTVKWFGGRLFAAPGAGARASRAIQVLTRSPLSPRQQLVLIRVGRRLVLVADGGAQSSTVCEITDPDEVAALVGQLNDEKYQGAPGKAFNSLVGRFRRRYDADDVEMSRALSPSAFDREDGEGREQSGYARPDRASARTDDNDWSNVEPVDPAVVETRQELSGLLEKVRLVSKQFKVP